EAIFGLWDVIREISSRHEKYPDANWAFSSKVQARLAKVRDRLAPNDPVLASGWLFGRHVELSHPSPTEDFDAPEQAGHTARVEALRKIASEAGAEGVFRLVDRVYDSHMVGWIVGQLCLLEWDGIGLPAILDASDQRRLDFAGGYIRSRYQHEGMKFVNS